MEQSLRELAAQGKAPHLPDETDSQLESIYKFYNKIVDRLTESSQKIEQDRRQFSAVQKLYGLTDFSYDQKRFNREALKIFLETLNFDLVALYGVNSSNGGLTLQSKLVREEISLPAWEELSLWQEAINRAAQFNQIFLSQDQREIKEAKTEPQVLSKIKPAILAVPLIQKGVVTGVLAGGSFRQAFFCPEEIELLLSLCRHLTVNLENFRLYQDVRDKVIEVTTFNRIGQALSSILDVDQLLKQLLQIVTTSFGYSVCAVLLYDQEKNELVSRALWGYPPEVEEKGVRLKMPGPGLCSVALHEGEPVLSNDVNSDPRYLRGWPDCKSELVVPLKTGEAVIGVLNVESERSGAFTEKDVHVLTNLASQISILLQNARLFQEEREKTGQLIVADQINRAIASTLDLNLIFEIVHQGLAEFMGQDGTYFYFYNPQEHSFQREFVAGNLDVFDSDKLPKIPASQTCMWDVVQNKEVFVCKQLLENDYTMPIQAELYRIGMRSYILVPVFDGEEVIGCFNLGSRKPFHFGKRETEICQLVANHLSVAIKNSRLYQELKDAYENLKNSQETLLQSEKLRTLGEMASGMVHDFNNLLATILGRTQILLQKLEGLDGPSKETYLKNLKAMEKAAQDGSHLLSQISQFGKAKAELNLEPVQLNEVVLDSLELTRPRWKNQSEAEGINIEVKTDLRARTLIKADAPQLREVLMNLIINAIDAMPQGGSLTLRTGENDRQVWLEVQDTGTGISEEILPKIFDPFFTTKGKKGTGLGLPICLSIVRRLRGEIKVESETGKGSRFRLIFPKLTEVFQAEKTGTKTQAAYPAPVFLLR